MIRNWLRKNLMFTLSMLAALITVVFVPPDIEYISYFDVKTLICLFNMMTIVCALQNINFFSALARKIVQSFKNLRAITLALTMVTIIGSMLITNDMALLAFLPLCYYILHSIKQTRIMAYVFVIMTVAANLGGMLTPFGNPQNLYLYSYYNIPAAEFLLIMLPPFALSTVMAIVCCLYVKSVPVTVDADASSFDIKKAAIYLALFVLIVLTVFRFVPYQFGLAAPLIILFLDKKALADVDYPLMGTFCAFFVFSGNMARISAVNDFLSGVVSKNTLVTGVITSQVISNVPAAVLLSKFTDNYTGLLTAVNIGGVGTPVASLASLITLKIFLGYEPKGAKNFMKYFMLLNVLFLAVLLIVFNYIWK